MLLKKNLLLIVLLIGTYQTVFSKNPNRDNAITSSENNSKQNSCGWLISWAGGSPSFGQNAIMFSTFYSKKLLPTVNTEIGLHYIGRSLTLPPIISNLGSSPAPTDSFRLYSTSWTGDITLFYKPFGDNFGIGIVPAIQWWRQMDNPFDLRVGLPELRLRESLALGGNFKIEYAFPLSKVMDIGIRGQIHGFLLPATTGGFDLPSTGSASLGIFLRGNW